MGSSVSEHVSSMGKKSVLLFFSSSSAFPARSLGFTILGEIFAYVAVLFVLLLLFVVWFWVCLFGFCFFFFFLEVGV